MKRVVWSTRFQKDVKRFQHLPDKITNLVSFIERLEKGEDIPSQF